MSEATVFRGQEDTRFTPWSVVKSWSCYGCGEVCCGPSTIPLTTTEWLNIINNFGVECTAQTLNGFYLRKTFDGRCVFQRRYFDKNICAIQSMKPQACKLWPFRISKQPRYGMVEEAVFHCWNERFYIYLETACRGIEYGKPSPSFVNRVLPEFIGLYNGLMDKQLYSTGNIASLQAKPTTARIIYM